ncbi:hypothetical protein [Fodinicurvata sp. EGI_FJ10296]|uniref:hypothetical protein n=1 Tax=Fodinicurvata sp. EGI_FJ10296 TaxID=3231908 RepID=UPI00345508EF
MNLWAKASLAIFLMLACAWLPAGRALGDTVRVADLPDAALFGNAPAPTLVTELSAAFRLPLSDSDAVLLPRARLTVSDRPEWVLLAYSFANGAPNPTGRSIPPIGLAVYRAKADGDATAGTTSFDRIGDWVLTAPEGGLPHGIDSVRLMEQPGGAVLRVAGPSLSISLDDQSLSRVQTLIPLTADGQSAGPSLTLPAEIRIAEHTLPDGGYGQESGNPEPTGPILTLTLLPKALATRTDAAAPDWPAMLIVADPAAERTEAGHRPAAIEIDIDPATGLLTASNAEAARHLRRLADSIGDDALAAAGLVVPELLRSGRTIAMIAAPDRDGGLLDRIAPPAPATPAKVTFTNPMATFINAVPYTGTKSVVTGYGVNRSIVNGSTSTTSRDGTRGDDYRPPRQRAVCDRLRWDGATVAANILGEGRLTNWLSRITHVAAADPMGRVRVTMDLCPGRGPAIAVPVEIPAADAARLLTGPRVGLTRLTGVPTALRSTPGVRIRALSASVPTS